MPAASRTMGGEIARRLSTDGSTAASRMATPATRYKASDTSEAYGCLSNPPVAASAG